MRECLNSEFGQGAERQEERGQAIPLNYFKEGNKELTVTQKSGRKSCTHRQSELCAATVSSLGPPCPTGTFRHDLCPARCCSLRPLSGLTAEGLLLEELLWPPPVQALWAGSPVPLSWGSSFPDGQRSPISPAQPPSHHGLCPVRSVAGSSRYYARALLSLSPFCAAPAPFSPRDDGTLSSLLGEKVNSS